MWIPFWSVSWSQSKLWQVTSRVTPAWQHTGCSMLTACWKASPWFSIHFRFVLLPSSSPFICPSLCSAAASEASHTLIHHLSSAVSVRAGRKKRKPEQIKGKMLIQRQKSHFPNLDFFLWLYDFMNFLSQPWELKIGAVALFPLKYRKTKPDVFTVQRKT